MSLPTPYYQDEHSTIYHGDCREILPLLEPVDLVLTDPPYGIGEGDRASKRTSNTIKPNPRWKQQRPTDYKVIFDDSQILTSELLLAMGLSKHSIVFGGNYYTEILAPSACWLIWDKKNGESDFADCELAWTTLRGAARKIEYLWNGFQKQQPEQRWHPTQKPLTVMRWCIEQADQKTKTRQETILDPFMGSGTTLVAAKNLGRKAIGIELEEKYCEIAVKRLRQGVLPLGGAA
jgi:DNA modification methylase